MRRSERTAHGLDDAHGSVVALGGHEDIVFCLEKSVEVELDARFAVASGDADNCKIRAGGKHYLFIESSIGLFIILARIMTNGEAAATKPTVSAITRPDANTARRTVMAT